MANLQSDGTWVKGPTMSTSNFFQGFSGNRTGCGAKTGLQIYQQLDIRNNFRQRPQPVYSNKAPVPLSTLLLSSNYAWFSWASCTSRPLRHCGIATLSLGNIQPSAQESSSLTAKYGTINSGDKAAVLDKERKVAQHRTRTRWKNGYKRTRSCPVLRHFSLSMHQLAQQRVLF